VDINRNFDVDWKNADKDNTDTYPGEHPFDQAESRILKTLMEKFQPHAYLDLHSGFKGMFFPNGAADDKDLAMKLQRLVAPVDESTCQCPLGIANVEVGYHTSGSALDYSFSVVKVPFSMAVEVYLGDDEKADQQSIKDRWEAQKKDLLKPLNTGSSFMENGIAPNPNLFPMQMIETTKLNHWGSSPASCLKYFNPVEEQRFKQVVTTWTDGLVELSIRSREIPANAATMAKQFGKKKSAKLLTSDARTTHDMKLRQTADVQMSYDLLGWSLKIFGLLLLAYLAVKFFKVRMQNQKSAEAEPLTAQMRPVQVTN